MDIFDFYDLKGREVKGKRREQIISVAQKCKSFGGSYSGKRYTATYGIKWPMDISTSFGGQPGKELDFDVYGVTDLKTGEEFAVIKMKSHIKGAKGQEWIVVK